MAQKGKAHSPHLSTQVRDFSGLRWRNITPTDIDCSIDFGGKLFVFVEAKLPGVTLPYGQRLHLERLTDAITESGRYAIAIVCEHPNRTGEIDFASCPVLEYRWLKTWYSPAAYTVKEAIDKTLVYCGINYVSFNP